MSCHRIRWLTFHWDEKCICVGEASCFRERCIASSFKKFIIADIWLDSIPVTRERQSLNITRGAPPGRRQWKRMSNKVLDTNLFIFILLVIMPGPLWKSFAPTKQVHKICSPRIYPCDSKSDGIGVIKSPRNVLDLIYQRTELHFQISRGGALWLMYYSIYFGPLVMASHCHALPTLEIEIKRLNTRRNVNNLSFY